jgi:hypothetical protein
LYWLIASRIQRHFTKIVALLSPDPVPKYKRTSHMHGANAFCKFLDFDREPQKFMNTKTNSTKSAALYKPTVAAYSFITILSKRRDFRIDSKSFLQNFNFNLF